MAGYNQDYADLTVSERNTIMRLVYSYIDSYRKSTGTNMRSKTQELLNEFSIATQTEDPLVIKDSANAICYRISDENLQCHNLNLALRKIEATISQHLANASSRRLMERRRQEAAEAEEEAKRRKELARRRQTDIDEAKHCSHLRDIASDAPRSRAYLDDKYYGGSTGSHYDAYYGPSIEYQGPRGYLYPPRESYTHHREVPSRRMLPGDHEGFIVTPDVVDQFARANGYRPSGGSSRGRNSSGQGHAHLEELYDDDNDDDDGWHPSAHSRNAGQRRSEQPRNAGQRRSEQPRNGDLVLVPGAGCRLGGRR